ncbi:DUF4334 domain-containing protein [Microbulbifer sp. OS29]|uniref:DUF4334 domain-containing protein n=1 Tax=Microbulbifer okhotskensis TaxID=2926617 RepID=A0A9X2ENV3_9GAMM|nr:DUF4334 domain-containing protein [Microbulbifer okhotskensis]MCO1335674.1 DUF4334 domain-containing protein [Microbulbifer okhotskensis]
MHLLTALEKFKNRDQVDPQELLEFYDTLSPLSINSLIGRWKAQGFNTQHPLQYKMDAGKRWYGKEFINPETVYPLLCWDSEFKAINTYDAPLFFRTQQLHTTTEAQARLRILEHRGKTSATMIYDTIPMHDMMRKVDENHILGLMERKGMDGCMFFTMENFNRLWR